MTADSDERIFGFDVARSLAILGMIVVHFVLVMGNGAHAPGWLSVILDLLDGRATAMFVILAGIGITLMARRSVSTLDPRAIGAIRRVLLRRGLFLLVLGYVNLTIWPGDILRIYGMSLLLAAPMLTVPSPRLLLAAAMYEIGFIALFLTVDFSSHWDWSTMTYHDLWTPAGVIRNLFYDGFRSVLPWTGLLHFGMWLGRQDLRARSVRIRLGLAAIATAISSEMVSRVSLAYWARQTDTSTNDTVQAVLGTASMPALPLFLAASGGLAVAVIIVCVRLVEVVPFRFWWPLAATGQMALTWYVTHIVLGLGMIEAMDQVGAKPPPVAAAWGIGFYVLAVAASFLWKGQFRQGPLEWVLRRFCG